MGNTAMETERERRIWENLKPWSLTPSRPDFYNPINHLAEIHMFGSIGMPELIIILVIALIIFGPRKLPELGRSLGRSINEFKKASNELRSTLEEEIRVEDQKERATAAAAAAPPSATPPPIDATVSRTTTTTTTPGTGTHSA